VSGCRKCGANAEIKWVNVYARNEFPMSSVNDHCHVASLKNEIRQAKDRNLIH